MGAADARHRLARTGFAARLADVDTFARLSRREAVERLLAQGNGAAVTPAPAWVGEWTDPRRVRAMDPDERKLFVREQIERGLELKGWWFSEMARTPAPLAERMTLFWHNHFTSSLQKVRSPALMYRQNVLLRRHALGNFGELLHAASRDPAMLVYLDAASNRRGQPNENFAREVMELFTLGEGHFREDDIREAARAFTGWSIDPASGEYLFRPRIHDSGEKTVTPAKRPCSGAKATSAVKTCSTSCSRSRRPLSMSPHVCGASSSRRSRTRRSWSASPRYSAQAATTSGAHCARSS